MKADLFCLLLLLLLFHIKLHILGFGVAVKKIETRNKGEKKENQPHRDRLLDSAP